MPASPGEYPELMQVGRISQTPPNPVPPVVTRRGSVTVTDTYQPAAPHPRMISRTVRVDFPSGASVTSEGSGLSFEAQPWIGYYPNAAVNTSTGDALLVGAETMQTLHADGSSTLATGLMGPIPRSWYEVKSGPRGELSAQRVEIGSELRSAVPSTALPDGSGVLIQDGEPLMLDWLIPPSLIRARP